MIETLGSITLLVGFALVLVGAIAGLYVAFRESILWGLACLFFPIAHLLFLILYWPVAKRPFMWWLTGLLMIILAAFALDAHVPGFHSHWHR